MPELQHLHCHNGILGRPPRFLGSHAPNTHGFHPSTSTAHQICSCRSFLVRNLRCRHEHASCSSPLSAARAIWHVYIHSVVCRELTCDEVNYYKGERWSHIHAITAFVCACLPIYKPLWTSISTAVGGKLSRYTANLRSTLGSRNDISENESSYRLGHVASPSNSTKSEEEKLHIGRGRTKDGFEIDQVPLHVLEDNIGYARKDDIV
jgi:hypothetical protein